MADVLCQGSEYGLNSSGDGIKTGVHLKLTDSAVRALDEYQSIKNLTNDTPSIQFKGNTGVLKIPGRSATGVRVFSFNLSALQGDQKGSFDCVQQHSACSGSTLDLVANLRHKVVINANDEVYQDTKEKMTIAEETSKKNCTKEIKPSGPYVKGRQIKKTVKKKLTPSLPPSGQPSNLGRMHSLHHASNNKQSGGNRLQPAPPPAKMPGLGNRVQNQTVPPSGKTSGRTAMGANSSLNGDRGGNITAVKAKSYRERIIHLLAVKPYKKPELILRLQKDNIRAKDKDSLSGVLQEVAKLNHRDNTFTLLKHMYKEVRTDWPFYTETDKQLIKRRIAQLSESPSHSPSSSQNSPPLKRPITDEVSEPAKRARISHYQSRTKVEPDSSHSENTVTRVNVTSKSAASSTSDTPDYVLQYTAITGDDQRRRYKEDFNSEYAEYRICHANVEKISKRFNELEDVLKKSQAGTADYETIKNKIYQEYKTIKSDSKYITEKKRCDYLHQKLSHIKKLVVEYDQTQHNS